MKDVDNALPPNPQQAMKPQTRHEKNGMFQCKCPTCYQNEKDWKPLIRRAIRRKNKQKLKKETK